MYSHRFCARRVRAVTSTLAGAALLILGAGCPMGEPFLDLASGEYVWADVITGYSYEVGQTATAGVTVSGASGELAYAWSISEPGVLIGPDDGLTVQFTASEPGSVTLVVTVTDAGTGTVATSADQVQFAASVDSADPLVAEAGEDRTVSVGNTIMLHGSASGGSGGYTFYWRQSSGPAQTIAPDWAMTAAITVIGTTPGTAVFEFIVEDYDGRTATDSVTVEVTGGSD